MSLKRLSSIMTSRFLLESFRDFLLYYIDIHSGVICDLIISEGSQRPTRQTILIQANIRMPKICLYLGSFIIQFLLLIKRTVSGDIEKVAITNESFRSKKNLAKEYIREVSILVVGGEVGDITLTLSLPLIAAPPSRAHSRPRYRAPPLPIESAY
jgi:hypothetical protein